MKKSMVILVLGVFSGTVGCRDFDPKSVPGRRAHEESTAQKNGAVSDTGAPGNNGFGQNSADAGLAHDAGPQTAPAPLCLQLRSGEDSELLPGQILLGREADGDCITQWEDPRALQFEITRDQPENFYLYGEVGMWYCVSVERHGGYITISHPAGDVTREEDVFTWCVRQNTEEPEMMIVRSLTSTSSFELSFPDEF